MDNDPAIAETVPAGNFDRHLPLTELERRWSALAPAPTETGCVVAMYARPDKNRRVSLTHAGITETRGMPGDRWSQTQSPKPDQQLATMQAPIAELIANGQDIAMFGDNLFFDLDLSKDNLPVGSRLRAGTAVLEVTPKPHNGCFKFKERFGGDALRFVVGKQTRQHNLRGIYLKVVGDGEIRVGDTVEVLRRPSDAGE
jgi:MOSC domain-containing protein YiiM